MIMYYDIGEDEEFEYEISDDEALKVALKSIDKKDIKKAMKEVIKNLSDNTIKNLLIWSDGEPLEKVIDEEKIENYEGAYDFFNGVDIVKEILELYRDEIEEGCKDNAYCEYGEQYQDEHSIY